MGPPRRFDAVWWRGRHCGDDAVDSLALDGYGVCDCRIRRLSALQMLVGEEGGRWLHQIGRRRNFVDEQRLPICVKYIVEKYDCSFPMQKWLGNTRNYDNNNLFCFCFCSTLPRLMLCVCGYCPECVTDYVSRVCLLCVRPRRYNAHQACHAGAFAR